jgi:hypothetical protein
MANGKTLSQEMAAQLYSAIREFDGFDDSVYDDFTGGSTTKEEIAQFNTRSIAGVARVAGKDSTYYEQAMAALGKSPITSGHVARELYGIVSALYRDVQSGYLETASELIHANLFSDFMEMGDYLLGEGYKDPAAVIIGGVLETHLRQLAVKNGIDTMSHPAGKPDVSKKAEALNQELSKAGAYGLLQQKSVTAWLDLRNKAAHTRYSEYDADDVKHFSQGLKDFIAKYPA